MKNQPDCRTYLGGSPAGLQVSRLCILTLAAVFVSSGAAAGLGQAQSQAQPDAAKPAPTVPDKPAPEQKPATPPAETMAGAYLVHHAIEVGGRVTTVTGSQPMWDTLVNQSSGGRVLGESLEMHSINPSKTPFFDSLSSSSTGYGGDPYDMSYLKFSKGRLYDFNGSFRRDRSYFDYNLLAQSLLGPTALVPEPDSLHLFNTVRRNMDSTLTLLPLSIVSFRAGFNHGTQEGPTYSTLHGGGDVQLLQWFRNASDTYTGGVDVKLAARTTLSYDQFVVFYKGDSSFQLTGSNYPILGGNGLTESLGGDTLSTATCGTGANKSLEVVNGVANPYCSGTIAENETAPTRTAFPTEQLRFSTHYWEKVSMNARILYSGATGSVNNFNETFNGLGRGGLRQEVETGALGNGRLANTKRIDVNGDYGIVAELSKYISVSDVFDYWAFRVPGSTSYSETEYIGTAATSILTPLSSLTPTTTSTSLLNFLNQKISSNTALATATVTPEFKLTGGWRFRTRNIADSGGDDLTWNENWAILGAVIQPTSMVRINANFDSMSSKSANAITLSNTFTREAPDKSYHLRARATVKPDKWVKFAITGNDYTAKNDDPFVNHFEHNQDLSFAATIIPTDTLSLDFNYAHDDVFSVTDICYISTAPLAGAANAGTCVLSTANPSGSPSLFLGNGFYNAPSNFFAGSLNYAPSKYFRFNGGLTLNDVNGQAEELNPLMVPGALQSKYVTPFADMLINVAKQWAWHGNWTHDGYAERGLVGYLPPRSTRGDIVTLGVKYAF